jgi:hypothetical protein
LDAVDMYDDLAEHLLDFERHRLEEEEHLH